MHQLLIGPQIIGDGGQRSPEIGREGLPLLPVDKATGPLKPGKTPVDDSGGGLGPLCTRERGGDELLEQSAATRLVQDDFRQPLGPKGDQVFARERRARRTMPAPPFPSASG